MLFILIPIVWLALVAIVVAGCRLAARGDANVAVEPSRPGGRSPRQEPEPLLSVPGLKVWDAPDPAALRGVAEAMSAPRPALPGPAARRPNGRALRASRARSVRRHGVRSPARS